MITPENGTVLDPFMGSGSTGKACVYENKNFIGIEREEDYIEIAEARIEFAKNDRRAIVTNVGESGKTGFEQLGLFGDCDGSGG